MAPQASAPFERVPVLDAWDDTNNGAVVSTRRFSELLWAPLVQPLIRDGFLMNIKLGKPVEPFGPRSILLVGSLVPFNIKPG